MAKSVVGFSTSLWLFGFALVVPIAGNIDAVTPIVQYGDAPYCVVHSSSVYFVDRTGETINVYDTESRQFHSAQLDDVQVRFIVPLQDPVGAYAVGTGRELSLYTWMNDSTIAVFQATIPIADPGDAISTGKCDLNGRLLVGTVNGCLYLVKADSSVEKLLSQDGPSKGMAWSMFDLTLYCSNSNKSAILQFKYDLDAGTIDTTSTVFFDLTANSFDSEPGGITVDADGNLWIALYNTNEILHVNHVDGKVLTVLKMPDFTVTSVAFGGPKLDFLYVTSLIDGKNANAGALFRVDVPNVIGLPDTSAVLNLQVLH